MRENLWKVEMKYKAGDFMELDLPTLGTDRIIYYEASPENELLSFLIIVFTVWQLFYSTFLSLILFTILIHLIPLHLDPSFSRLLQLPHYQLLSFHFILPIFILLIAPLLLIEFILFANPPTQLNCQLIIFLIFDIQLLSYYHQPKHLCVQQQVARLKKDFGSYPRVRQLLVLHRK